MAIDFEYEYEELGLLPKKLTEAAKKITAKSKEMAEQVAKAKVMAAKTKATAPKSPAAASPLVKALTAVNPILGAAAAKAKNKAVAKQVATKTPSPAMKEAMDTVIGKLPPSRQAALKIAKAVINKEPIGKKIPNAEVVRAAEEAANAKIAAELKAKKAAEALERAEEAKVSGNPEAEELAQQAQQEIKEAAEYENIAEAAETVEERLLEASESAFDYQEPMITPVVATPTETGLTYGAATAVQRLGMAGTVNIMGRPVKKTTLVIGGVLTATAVVTVIVLLKKRKEEKK